ncbi:MAG: phosphoribosylformylglycinamidine synthase subunit PurS [Acidimicrobiia bacterium]
MRVTVEVTRRPEIADPEGATTQRALHDLGYAGLTSVRFDRLIHLEIDGDDRDQIHDEVESMCREVLVNPVLEDYHIEVGP